MAYLGFYETETYNTVLDWARHAEDALANQGPHWLKAGVRTLLDEVRVALLLFIAIYQVALIVLFHVVLPSGRRV